MFCPLILQRYLSAAAALSLRLLPKPVGTDDRHILYVLGGLLPTATKPLLLSSLSRGIRPKPETNKSLVSTSTQERECR